MSYDRNMDVVYTVALPLHRLHPGPLVQQPVTIARLIEENLRHHRTHPDAIKLLNRPFELRHVRLVGPARHNSHYGGLQLDQFTRHPGPFQLRRDTEVDEIQRAGYHELHVDVYTSNRIEPAHCFLCANHMNLREWRHDINEPSANYMYLQDSDDYYRGRNMVFRFVRDPELPGPSTRAQDTNFNRFDQMYGSQYNMRDRYQSAHPRDDNFGYDERFGGWSNFDRYGDRRDYQQRGSRFGNRAGMYEQDLFGYDQDNINMRGDRTARFGRYEQDLFGFDNRRRSRDCYDNEDDSYWRQRFGRCSYDQDGRRDYYDQDRLDRYQQDRYDGFNRYGRFDRFDRNTFGRDCYGPRRGFGLSSWNRGDRYEQDLCGYTDRYSRNRFADCYGSRRFGRDYDTGCYDDDDYNNRFMFDRERRFRTGSMGQGQRYGNWSRTEQDWLHDLCRNYTPEDRRFVVDYIKSGAFPHRLDKDHTGVFSERDVYMIQMYLADRGVAYPIRGDFGRFGQERFGHRDFLGGRL